MTPWPHSRIYNSGKFRFFGAQMIKKIEHIFSIGSVAFVWNLGGLFQRSQLLRLTFTEYFLLAFMFYTAILKTSTLLHLIADGENWFYTILHSKHILLKSVYPCTSSLWSVIPILCIFLHKGYVNIPSIKITGLWGLQLLQTAIVCVISGHHIVSPHNQILWFIIILHDLQP